MGALEQNYGQNWKTEDMWMIEVKNFGQNSHLCENECLGQDLSKPFSSFHKLHYFHSIHPRVLTEYILLPNTHNNNPCCHK